jgi:23S rRNA (uracil1939-C5)-methyltransferase
VTSRPAPVRQLQYELPQCRHFGECGGCSQLDQPIDWQLQRRVAAAEALLRPQLGGVPLESELPRRTPMHFRTRLLYPVRGDRDNLARVGIYAFHSHNLVRIEECRTQDLWLTALGQQAETVLRELRLPPYHPDGKRGKVMAFWARVGNGTGEALAGLVTQPGTFPEGAEFAQRLQEAAARIPRGRKARKLVGIVHSISEQDDSFLLGDRHVPLRGRGHLVDHADDLEFRISAGSFYQIHAEAAELLYAPALRLCGDVRGKTVVDGYGGVGAFGLRLAKAGAASVLVVEDSASACRDAEYNARKNQLPQVTVQRRAFAQAQLPREPDLMVVDPPRAGLGDAVANVLASRPRRLLHVACDAQSLARDLAALTAGGYRVTAARLCDLFPHTEHVEILALLER